MWSLLSRKTQITIIVVLSIVVLLSVQALRTWLVGSAQSPIQLISIIVFAVGTVFLAAFNFLWRWFWRKVPALERIAFPDLNGTWATEIQTNWKDPTTGLSPGPIEATVWIRQNLLSINVQQQTKESPSWSTRMFPYADSSADRYILWFSYDNKPHANVAGSSPDHEGVCQLEMNLNLDRNLMRGQYYTSRSTSGNMSLKRMSTKWINLPGRSQWVAGQHWNDFRY
jgi:hypothetical protein